MALQDEAVAKAHTGSKPRPPNPLMLGLSAPRYVLFHLRLVKGPDLEQALLVLTLDAIRQVNETSGCVCVCVCAVCGCAFGGKAVCGYVRFGVVLVLGGGFGSGVVVVCGWMDWSEGGARVAWFH